MDELANKYDTFEWLKGVIRSCETYRQHFASDRLIRNFYRLYKDRELKDRLDIIHMCHDPKPKKG